MIRTLDRYIVRELGGPSFFGLSAFSLIFAATYILNISRLVSDDHAPVWAAIEYFIYQMPQIIVLVIPMALLLGTLLALQRLSGESELTAMKAGGISLIRIVRPILLTGFAVSILSLALQELFVPFAQERAAYLLNDVIRHVGMTAAGLDVSIPLPGGGHQLTAAGGYDTARATLRDVTVIQYDRGNLPQQVIFSAEARFLTNKWLFTNARTYHFDADGTAVSSIDPLLQIDLGEDPSRILQRASNNNPDELSRAKLHDILSSKTLSDLQQRKYRSAYDAKLAQPFACLVFTLIALPFGLRPARGSGTSVGFGLAVAIVFVYYVILTIARGVATSDPPISVYCAWAPNLLFSGIGITMLRRVAAL
jgi:lipopolysaccharide export system permease protein